MRYLFVTILLSLFSFSFTQTYCQQSKIDSLLKLNENTKTDTVRLRTLLSLSDYYSFQNPDSALLFAKRAKILAKRIKSQKFLAGAFRELGWSYFVSGNYSAALDNYFEALKISENNNDRKYISSSYGNIGAVYKEMKDYVKAKDYYFKALKIDEKSGNNDWIASDISNIGIIYMEEGNYSKALEYYFKALKINEETGNKREIAIKLGNIGNVYVRLGENMKENQKRGDSLYNIALGYYSKAIKIDEELGRKTGIAIKLGNIGNVYTKIKKYKEAEEYLQQALVLSDSIGAVDLLDDWHQSLSQLYEQTHQPGKALEHYKEYIHARDSIFNIESSQKSTRLEMNYKFEKEQATEKAEQEKKDAIATAKKHKQFIILLFVLLVLILVSVFAVISTRQKNVISKEKKRSDELLHSILPSETAEELKQYGFTKPKQFDQVTVLFTDFKGFTKIAEKMTAEELVNELNLIFGVFDLIISKYPIEKIKTIGDSYMCVGGLPTPNKTNPRDMVSAALEIQKYINNRNLKSPEAQPWQIRIGVHTGTVVAGVVGIKKFAYDIWGDTVNTASRMESSGEPGKVNISGSTYEFIKDFPEFVTEYRGEIEAKNKGKIKMYFVEKG